MPEQTQRRLKNPLHDPIALTYSGIGVLTRSEFRKLCSLGTSFWPYNEEELRRRLSTCPKCGVRYQRCILIGLGAMGLGAAYDEMPSCGCSGIPEVSWRDSNRDGWVQRELGLIS